MAKFTGKIETRIAVAFGISLAIFAMELIGGFLVNVALCFQRKFFLGEPKLAMATNPKNKK